MNLEQMKQKFFQTKMGQFCQWIWENSVPDYHQQLSAQKFKKALEKADDGYCEAGVGPH